MPLIPGVPKRLARRSVWLCAIVLFVATSAWAQSDAPALTQPVNDFAGVIDPGRARQLETLIRALQSSSGDVIAVATVKSLGGDDIRDYADRLFRNQGKGIGQTGKDNGLLLLVSIDDRQAWVEVGYDLEQFITDGFAGQTVRQELAPRFREGDYGAGILAGVQRLAGRIAEGRGVTIEGATRPRDRRRAPGSGSGGNIIIVLIVLFLLINGISGRLGGRRRGRWGGGGWSGWSSGVGPFGGGFGGRGGGFGGGFGGFGGGGGGGGGFGGFGGGRSGGGGASGGW